MAFPFEMIVGAVAGIIDKLIPDQKAAAEAKIKLFELQQNGQLAELQAATELAKAQIETNKVEAASASLFRGGWRPAVGWACVAALVYQLLVRPLLAWYSASAGWTVPPPLEMGDLMTLLFGMLGLGAYRTAEKIKGLP